MQNKIIESINQSQIQDRPFFEVGDRVSVSVRLKEGDKERIQVFRGIVLCKTPKSGKGLGASFTVRKIASGVGVERQFKLNSPFITKIEVESSAEVRRSRLFYLRGLSGKKARLKERGRFEEVIKPEPVVAAPASTTEDTATSEEAGDETKTTE